MNLNIGNIGIWGFRHYEFLKRNRPSTVGVMRMNGTLEGYLKQVNQDATAMLESIIQQYAKSGGVTEALKRTDQLGWVQKMNLKFRIATTDTVLLFSLFTVSLSLLSRYLVLVSSNRSVAL